MEVFHPDPTRTIEIPGAPEPVQRPVDIDRSRTGFTNLRSLRIYRFDAGVTINGHAEEDEVFIVVLAGSVEFSATDDKKGAESRTFQLSAPHESQTQPCAAYLPPCAAYRLIASTDSVVAYARATPMNGNPPKAFETNVATNGSAIQMLLDETTYARRLRLRLAYVDAKSRPIDFAPVTELEAGYEALVHIQSPAPGKAVTVWTSGDDPTPLNPWDTVAIVPGERPVLRFTEGCSALVFIVLAI
jgi:hypothetical protein